MSRRRNGSTALLERLLEPVKLACKCNEGELTPAERYEYERYVTAGNLIAILQAKARLLLTKKT